MKSNACLVSAVGVLMALSSGATETVVGRYGHADFTSASTVAADDVWFVSSYAGWVTKSGAGAWTLPLSNFLGFFGNGFELGLRGGTLDLASGTSPDYVTTPPAALQKAAVWLSADKNVATDGSTGRVLGWYDAREASAAAADYGYAAPAADDSPVSAATFQGKTSISFGGYYDNGKQSLLLKTAAGAAASVDMCDAFYVFGYNDGKSFAPVLGNAANTSQTYFFTNPGAGTVLSRDGNAFYETYQCGYRRNGVEEDPTVGLATSRLHVVEFQTSPGRTIPVDSLLNDRNKGSGGGYVQEFLLFATRLTDLERAQVTAYLLQKWGIDTGTKLVVNAAEGTLVRMSDAQTLNRMSFAGRGAICTTSSSDATLQAILGYGNRDSSPRYRLSTAGETLEMQGVEYAHALQDGDAITVDDSSKFVRKENNASGAGGTTVVQGARRTLVFDSVPKTKLKVTSGAGDAFLRAPASEANYRPGDAAAATPAATALTIPVGTGGATTTVEIPTAGDWEVEFDIQNTLKMKTGTSWSDGLNASYSVIVTDSSDRECLNKVVQTVDPSEVGGVVPHRRFLLRDLAVGTYTIKVAGMQSTTFQASLSNLAFAFVPQTVRETVVPVVGGDFENNTAMKKPYFASRENNGGSGWTLTNGGLTANPAVQTVVNSMMLYQQVGATKGYQFQFRSHELGRYGDTALAWIHTNSTSKTRNTARAQTATILPAGTWRLRMKACRMTTGTDYASNVDTNPADNLKRCGKYLAIYSATVKVNGGEAIDLGRTDAVDSFFGKTYYYPNAFTVEDNASVVVSLDQHVGWSFSLIDDLEFVRVDTLQEGGLGPELVQNGSFETKGAAENDMAGWTRDEYNDGSTHCARRLDALSSSQYYGRTICDGPYVCRSVNGGRASQLLTLEKGVYRLSFWARARCDLTGGVWTPTYLCKVHFWLSADGSSVTNAICDSDTLWATNFTQKTALFEVKEPGAYHLGFNADMGSKCDSLTDCVSVRKVLGATAVPDVDPDADLDFNLTDGKLRLDYTGTLSVDRLRVNGKRFYGEVSAGDYPEYLAGPGKVNVTGERRGVTIIFR